MDLLTHFKNRAVELDASDSAARAWADWYADDGLPPWRSRERAREEATTALTTALARIASDRTLLDEQLEEAKAWGASVRDLIHGMIAQDGEADAWATLVRWRETVPDFGQMLLDAQAFQWVDTTEAAQLYGCSTSYMRRLARREFGPHERRKHPDGGWRYLRGSVRQRKSSS